MSQRALLIKMGAIGDVLMVVPAARALHDAGYAIDWVCAPGVRSLLACYPWIETTVADERAILTGRPIAKVRALTTLWRALAGRRYDLIATLYYDPRYALLSLPLGAARKLSLSHTERSRRILPGRHHSDEFMRILTGRPDGVHPIEVAPLRPERLPASPLPRTANGRARVILAPAGARNLMAEAILRRWPAERYVTLAGHLLSEGCEVVLTGGPEDAWVQPLFAALAVTDMIGRTSLPETVALLDTADVFITHDTGPLHLSGITKCGIVALFGPTDPHMFMPQRPGTVAIWGGEGFACRPCYDGHSFASCPANDCMRQIPVDMVLEQVRAMLRDRASGALAAPRFLTPASTTRSAPSVPLVQLNQESTS